MNTTQQQSQIAKKIFEKVDEFKEWSVKVEELKEEYNRLIKVFNEVSDDYNRLDKNFDLHRKGLRETSRTIEKEINKSLKEIDIKTDYLNNLELKISEKQKEFEKFKREAYTTEKDLTDKIKGIEAELVELDKKKEEKIKEINSIQLEAKLAAVSYEQLKEETEKLAQKLLGMKNQITDLERREKNVSIREQRLKSK